MTPETKRAELSTGVTVMYGEQGDPDGAPLLLLHGIGDSWHSFELVMRHLPDSIRALAMTQRGHGDSSRPEASYRYDDFAGDVAALLDALDVGSAVIAGHSMGSTVAQRFAMNEPERTDGLVLAGSFLSVRNTEAPRELQAAVAELEDPVDPQFVREFQEGTTAGPVPREFMETVIQETMKLPARVWREVVEGTMRDDCADELDTIEAPTLLVWGDRDEIVPRSDQEAQSERLGNSRLVVYEGAGHAIPWEEPERFASDLASFVQSVTH